MMNGVQEQNTQGQAPIAFGRATSRQPLSHDELSNAVAAYTHASVAQQWPKQGDLILLRDLFPEVEAASEKLLAMLQRPADSGSTWSTGALPTDRPHRVDAVRKFYRDGAYRLYAPAIDYDRVLAEARQARTRQVSLGKRLAQWAAEFKLGDDHKPILVVLREAGLIT